MRESTPSRTVPRRDVNPVAPTSAPEPTSAQGSGSTPGPSTLVARSSLEAFLWIFVTRLIALLTSGRAASAPEARAEVGGAPDRPTVDPARARRVAASRGEAVGGAPVVPPAPTIARTGEDRARAVAVTAATAAVGAAAAFAVGRRRGSR